ncbi:MAG: TIGR02206 family membrane protein [Clostridia bacterium]|nr:TIGR02206 family membrane protein [Clostridia bacterium]
MPLLTTLLLFLLLLPLCCRIRACRLGGRFTRARQLYRLGAWLLGGMVLAAMAAQETILLLAGQLTWATALPLHLCSLMGLCTLPALLTRRETLLHALLLLGAPGAALALLFPAIMDTPWPRVTRLFFIIMHAGIFLAPLLPLSLGWRPRCRGACQAGVFLLTAGAVALPVNRLTGGNYLFLSGPVAGTPLILLHQWGWGSYLLLLAALAALLLTTEAVLMRLCVCTKRRRTGEMNENPRNTGR